MYIAHLLELNVKNGQAIGIETPDVVRLI